MGARNIVRLLGDALIADEAFDLESGEVLSFLPVVDDQGAIEIGDGSTDLDLKIFLGSTTQFALFDVGNNKVQLNTALEANGGTTLAGDTTVTGAITTTGTGREKLKVNALTSNTTLNTTHFGGIVTTRGAGGAVTLTLPAAAGNTGEWVRIINVADQNLIVEGAAGELVTFNDAEANSVAFQTVSEKIGGGLLAVSDGTSWLIFLNTEESQTVTVVT